jgi:hypothetical protein
MTAAPVEDLPERDLRLPLDVNSIRIDGGTQPRVQLDGATVGQYADAILHQGAKFPPIDVFWDGAYYWLADGFHRLFAHQMLAENDAVSSMLAKLGQDVTVIDATVHHGTQRQAILFSVAANAKHGLPRKPEDKRQAIATLVRDVQSPCLANFHLCRTKPREEQCWNAWADREIARECGVSHTTVADERQKFHAELQPGQDGQVTTRTYTDPRTGQPTSQTITRAPSPEPVPEHHPSAEVAAMPAGYQADLEDYAPTVQTDGVHPATERAIDTAIKAQIFALSLRITPTTFDDALPPLMRDKVTATFDVLFPWLKALETSREAD